MESHPTVKQWKFAKAISDKLHIPMPKEYTKGSYFNYIKNNKDAFYEQEPSHSNSIYNEVGDLISECCDHLIMG